MNGEEFYQQRWHATLDKIAEMQSNRVSIINESPLGWSLLRSPTNEVIFLSREKGWTRELVEDVKRLLGYE